MLMLKVLKRYYGIKAQPHTSQRSIAYFMNNLVMQRVLCTIERKQGCPAVIRRLCEYRKKSIEMNQVHNLQEEASSVSARARVERSNLHISLVVVAELKSVPMLSTCRNIGVFEVSKETKMAVVQVKTQPYINFTSTTKIFF